MTLGNDEEIEKKYIELDGWYQETKGCRNYSELPSKAKEYISFLERTIEIPITLLSTSPEREDTILFKDPFKH